MKLSYLVIGTGDRNLRDISPNKVVIFFFFLQEIYPFASEASKESEDECRNGKNKELVTRKVTVDSTAKKVVRLEYPNARLWALALSRTREVSSRSLRRMLHHRKAEKRATEIGGNATQEKLEHRNDFTNRLPEVQRNLKQMSHLELLVGFSPCFRTAF